LVLLLGIILAGMFFNSQGEDEGIEIETTLSEKRSIKETVSASGRIYPEVEVVISSDVSGEIVNLYVEEGDSVVQGQTLIKIDPEAYLSTVERGEADLNNAKANLAMSRAQIETSRARREELTTTLIQAERNHKRNESLFKQEVISQVEYDQTLSRRSPRSILYSEEFRSHTQRTTH